MEVFFRTSELLGPWATEATELQQVKRYNKKIFDKWLKEMLSVEK